MKRLADSKDSEMNSKNESGYRPRRTELLQRTIINHWNLKLYSIVADGTKLSTDILDSVFSFLTNDFDWPEHLSPNYGFVTIHHGEDAVWLLVDLWVDEILHHFLFSSNFQKPASFVSGPADGTAACVWELEVTKHERDAWVEHVLSKPQRPDFEGYLNDCLDIQSR